MTGASMVVPAGRRAWRAAALVLACLLLRAVPARAEHADVGAGRAAYQQGDFLGALVRLETAQRSPLLSEEDLVSLHWYRAACHHALGHAEDTATALDALLVLRPLYEPDPLETPPPLRATWLDRQAAWDAEHGVDIGPPVFDGAVLVVPLGRHVEDVADVLVHLRAPGEPVFRAAVLPALGGQARGVPLDAASWASRGAGPLDMVVEARNRRGVVVARRGHALHPVPLDVDDATRDALVAALTPPAVEVEPPPAAPAPLPARDLDPVPVTPLPHPAQSAGVAATWAAYAVSGTTLAVLAVLMVAVVFFPPLAPALLGGALAGAVGTGAVTWWVAQRLGRWRSPLWAVMLAAAAPTLACAGPVSLATGACWTAWVVFNPITVSMVQGARLDDLWLVYFAGVCGCGCLALPWLGSAVLGLLGGAAGSSFMVTELGRSADPDEKLENRDVMGLDGAAVP